MSLVPPGIKKPPYADSGDFPPMEERPQVHDAAGIAKMRAAGRLAARVLDFAGTLVRPGVTTDEIDKARRPRWPRTLRQPPLFSRGRRTARRALPPPAPLLILTPRSAAIVSRAGGAQDDH